MKSDGARPARTRRALRGAEPIGGRGEAWRGIVDRYAPYVHAVLVRAYGFDTHRAEDAFVEVFARLWIQLDRSENHRRGLDGVVRELARRVAAEHVTDESEQPDKAVLHELDDALMARKAIGKLRRSSARCF